MYFSASVEPESDLACVQFTASFCETNIGYIRGTEKPETGVKLPGGGDSYEGAHTFLFLSDERVVWVEKLIGRAVRCVMMRDAYSSSDSYSCIGKKMSECVFCGIASGEIEADIVAGSDEWLAFRDLNPTAPCHILVIPRRHVQSMNDLGELDSELLGELLFACQKVANGEGLESGYRIVTNTGEEGGQAISHLHFHVLGGRQMQWPPG